MQMLYNPKYRPFIKHRQVISLLTGTENNNFKTNNEYLF